MRTHYRTRDFTRCLNDDRAQPSVPSFTRSLFRYSDHSRAGSLSHTTSFSSSLRGELARVHLYTYRNPRNALAHSSRRSVSVYPFVRSGTRIPFRPNGRFLLRTTGGTAGVTYIHRISYRIIIAQKYRSSQSTRLCNLSNRNRGPTVRASILRDVAMPLCA